MLFSLLISFLLALSASVSASQITLYIEPIPTSSTPSSSLPPSSPTPIAVIDYDYQTSSASRINYTPPEPVLPPATLYRFGLYDPNTQTWRGVVTSGAMFAPTPNDSEVKKFILHVDESGQIYHVEISPGVRPDPPMGKYGKEEDEGVVEVVKRNAGPRPLLNKPVVLNAEGKLEGKEPEKTFLQKYWWALALFVAVQFLAGGGEK